ncbi:MAG: tRNA threonylcarbamoyladenosine dehydratase [Rubrivivax sp. SCN 70-15]|nr:MAG: tRNA threonylcarbamoyladenosine dehydratase [Rubrivivax sp. SCN 70-15]
MSALADTLGADLERRFGGLRRLYGDAAYARLRSARVAVVGLGGVGSWTAEALARSGVARLVLIDFDHIAESNINRQVQALGATVGQAKGQALRERIADIHPGCEVREVDDFVTPDNWPGLLDAPVDVLVDACDQVRAKAALAVWSLAERVPLVCVGAAGGKRQAQRVEVDDLAATTHDPLLASLRQRLRKLHGAPRHGPIGLHADACASDGSLNCSGYGSSVTVTATFGMVAAGEAIELLLASASLQGGAKFCL